MQLLGAALRMSRCIEFTNEQKTAIKGKNTTKVFGWANPGQRTALICIGQH